MEDIRIIEELGLLRKILFQQQQELQKLQQKHLPSLKDKFNGLSIRVPVSLDLYLILRFY